MFLQFLCGFVSGDRVARLGTLVLQLWLHTSARNSRGVAPAIERKSAIRCAWS